MIAAARDPRGTIGSGHTPWSGSCSAECVLSLCLTLAPCSHPEMLQVVVLARTASVITPCCLPRCNGIDAAPVSESCGRVQLSFKEVTLIIMSAANQAACCCCCGRGDLGHGSICYPATHEHSSNHREKRP